MVTVPDLGIISDTDVFGERSPHINLGKAIQKIKVVLYDSASKNLAVMKLEDPAPWHSLVGGSLKNGETPIVAAVREILGKTGKVVTQNALYALATYTENRNPIKHQDPTAVACVIRTTAFLAMIKTHLEKKTDYNEIKSAARASIIWVSLQEASRILRTPNKGVYASFFNAKIDPVLLNLAENKIRVLS